jgi:hypothetical protein
VRCTFLVVTKCSSWMSPVNKSVGIHFESKGSTIGSFLFGGQMTLWWHMFMNTTTTIIFGIYRYDFTPKHLHFDHLDKYYPSELLRTTLKAGIALLTFLLLESDTASLFSLSKALIRTAIKQRLKHRRPREALLGIFRREIWIVKVPSCRPV